MPMPLTLGTRQTFTINEEVTVVDNFRFVLPLVIFPLEPFGQPPRPIQCRLITYQQLFEELLHDAILPAGYDRDNQLYLNYQNGEYAQTLWRYVLLQMPYPIAFTTKPGWVQSDNFDAMGNALEEPYYMAGRPSMEGVRFNPYAIRQWPAVTLVIFGHNELLNIPIQINGPPIDILPQLLDIWTDNSQLALTLWDEVRSSLCNSVTAGPLMHNELATT
jgi:hypothetical protein